MTTADVTVTVLLKGLETDYSEANSIAAHVRQAVNEMTPNWCSPFQMAYREGGLSVEVENINDLAYAFEVTMTPVIVAKVSVIADSYDAAVDAVREAADIDWLRYVREATPWGLDVADVDVDVAARDDDGYESWEA